MPLLDGALAFALTMLLIATAVTAVVRAVHAVAKSRRQQLKLLLENFYAHEVGPVVRSELARLGHDPDGEVARDLLDRAESVLGPLRRSPDLPRPAGAVAEPAGNRIDELELVEVGTGEMVERLRRCELGEALARTLKDDAEAVFERFAERYEASGALVSESFRNQSRRWSTVVAIVLALLLNIDSFYVLTTYLSNDDARDAVVAQYDAILAGHEEAAQGGASDAGEAVAAARRQLAALELNGFPIGWPRFPYCAAESVDPRCVGHAEGIAVEARTVLWLFGCLLTGVLAGLGAPFWFDVVSGIARSARSFRKPRRETADAAG